MDATRADVEFTAEVLQIALDEGATTINIPDTGRLRDADRVRRRSHPPLRAGARLGESCFPCTATTTSGWRWRTPRRVQAGARQVECAINGIGERAATRRSRRS
jgi:2-isopropylmalate synthase